VKLGEDGTESMKFSAIYNADRRTGVRFDPASETFRAELGEHELEVAPGGCVGSVPGPVLYVQECERSASGRTGEDHRGQADRRLVDQETIRSPRTVPNVLWSTVKIGDDSYRVSLRFNDKGVFKPALGYERSAFVVSKGSLVSATPGKDSAKLSLLLADPSVSYEAGVSTLRVRILDGTNVLFDRDFTALGGREGCGRLRDRQDGLPRSRRSRTRRLTIASHDYASKTER
jgi:hypothetical protein